MKILKKIFSVRNDNIHKVITILGLKFKLKSKKLIERNKCEQLERQTQQLELQIQDYNQQIQELNIKLDKLNLNFDFINKRFNKVLVPPEKKDIIHFKESNELIQLNKPKNFASVGKYTYSNSNLFVETPLQSKIGAFCSIGANVVIGHGEHPMEFLSTSPYFYLDRFGFKNKDMISYDKYWTHNLKGVDVGNDVWIGTGVFIKNGITIGDGAIIGAKSVVTKDVPPYAIVVGNPAKIIRYRFNEQIIKELLELKWWNLEDEIIKQIPYDNINQAITFLKERGN